VITVRDLVSSEQRQDRYTADQLAFSLDEVIDREILGEADLVEAIEPIRKKFQFARDAALENTKLYLSMIADLDIYVATSMRNRDDFRAMVTPIISMIHAKEISIAPLFVMIVSPKRCQQCGRPLAS
jgi:hypothetical protein